MISHHEEAIASAGELSRSQRAPMRALGRSIVEGQTREVGLMRALLAREDPGRPAAPYDPMMRDLGASSGDDLDRTFLQDMAVHHMAAVMMSRHALAAGLLHDPEVADLARRIVTAQRREIALMLRWSHDWFGTGPGSGAGPMRR
ncbi:DUF305 domain-containing protein [Nocardioides rubriscoriae]|uniref:DUF305 domain-containing protein n=1 Tax=Nocardioides rubriscoriae TaxID=642762 RepID=UPI0011DFD8CD|nr:DUF305 domain-containing protein [Nocardioides rubriscoriae]